MARLSQSEAQRRPQEWTRADVWNEVEAALRLAGDSDPFASTDVVMRAVDHYVSDRLAAIVCHMDRLEAWCRDATRDNGQALGGIVADLRRAVDGQEE